MGIILRIIIVLAAVGIKFFAGADSLPLMIVFLAAGFFMLIKGADWFVDGASGVADRFGISQLMIGLTIVAFGTSAPEAAVSITAATKGSGVDIAIGNVLGSNIMNILLILGLSALICPLPVQKSTKKIEIPSVIFVTILVLGLGMPDGEMGRTDGFILLGLMAVFLIYTIGLAKKGGSSGEETEIKKLSVYELILNIICGGAAIVLGSDITVSSATSIARVMGMSEKLIGLTIIAFGTSLPELITSCVASAKKKPDIAVGNIVGSNIFNILFVLAISAVITPLPYRNPVTGADFFIDNLVAVGAAVILMAAVLNKDSKIKRSFGFIMLLAYAAYFTHLLMA
ncbi:MAG: calcium/sodium antiporter [Lachnospiraceae bacterium]|nr:calcium/sodium antiporter [Lachnospiraceae bacterium]